MPTKGVRDDIEEADDEESYYKWLEENPNAGRSESYFFENSLLVSPRYYTRMAFKISATKMRLVETKNRTF